jgi:hypothetical protein
VSADFQADDLAAVRAEGSLADLFAHLAGKPLPEQAEPVTDEPPSYHIRSKGAWPCGTAPSGPTPPPCDDCRHEDHDTHRGAR